MIETCEASIGAPDTGESVRFFWEAHEFRFDPSSFESDEGLFALLDWAAMVMFVMDNERGGLGFAQIFDR